MTGGGLDAAAGGAAGLGGAGAAAGPPPAGAVLTGANDVLMVVDVQRDFCPGGALAVEGANEVIPVINGLLPKFGRWVYTRDWHPHDHISFSDHPEFRDGSWPPHAVQGTPGAAWCDGLEMPINSILVSKGDDRDLEEYSGFPTKRLDLAEFLRRRKVERVFIAGLTADYCVRRTAIDARAAGFTVFVVEDAVRGVAPDTTMAAFAEMDAAGVIRVHSTQIVDSGVRPPAAYDEHGNPVRHDG